MTKGLDISCFMMIELSSFVLSLLKLGLVIAILVIGYFVFSSTRTFSKGTSGKKMSFRKRTPKLDAEIILSKSKRSNPLNIAMSVTNTGTKDLDLHAPEIIFKRWFSKRKFRVLKVEHSEIYPIFLEPGNVSELNISLNQFYKAVPELQLACRMSIEMKDQRGKRFKSHTIRLKWF